MSKNSRELLRKLIRSEAITSSRISSKQVLWKQERRPGNMPALIERPKMSRAMWEAIKAHILRERQKKKQEQEADAAIERLRRERENKQKQDVMTLEETKEQIQQLEQRVNQLKEEKHQLFLQLKKVLNEDELRRRAIPKEANDMISFSHGYPPHSVQLGGHPNVFLQTGPMAGRSPMYKISASHQQAMLPPGALKRPRSPSPPPTNYQQGYNYKAQAVAAYGQKSNQFAGQPTPYYPHSSNQSHSSASTSFPPTTQTTAYTYSGHGQYTPSTAQQAQHAQQQQSSSASEPSSKHVPHGYHVQHIQQQGYVGPLHQQLEQANQKAGFTEEKFFAVQQHSAVPIRGVSSMHHPQTLIPIQTQAKPGGITSGYPVRGQPSVTSASAYQSSSQQHSTYASQQSTTRHVYSTQPPPGRYY